VSNRFVFWRGITVPTGQEPWWRIQSRSGNMAKRNIFDLSAKEPLFFAQGGLGSKNPTPFPAKSENPRIIDGSPKNVVVVFFSFSIYNNVQ
jgi:hypothetical protein